MADIRLELAGRIRKAMADSFGSDSERIPVELVRPAIEEHGDWSCNIAFRLAGKLKRGPAVVAEELAGMLAADMQDETSLQIEDISVAGGGFINFKLDPEYFRGRVSAALADNRYGEGNLLSGKKVMIEFTDPNPFKVFHIGHLYSNAVGESLARLMESQGAELRRANYQGDVGMHVAKSVWGMRKLISERGVDIEELGRLPLSERQNFLGEAYALGAAVFEDDSESREVITGLNAKIFASDPEVLELYDAGRQWSLDYFETIYARLGTKFDYYYFESEAGKAGLELVRRFQSEGVFEESDGAVVFPGEKYGLHRRVFINSQGLPTYEAKELGLAPAKFEDFKYDRSVIVTANEVDEYFKVLIQALKIIAPELGERTEHVSHGVVRLPEGKMSSRTGTVIKGEWLIDEAKSRIFDRMRATSSDLAHSEEESVAAEMVAVAAVKYALLRHKLGHDIEFDFDESISLEGNSGPYLQYTYARIRSVLDKADEGSANTASQVSASELTEAELKVARWLDRFPEVLAAATEARAPHLVCNYLFETAQRFNSFYSTNQIAGNLTRMELSGAVANVIQRGLGVLGISTPERM